MNLDDIAARLGVSVEDVYRVHRLAGDHPSAPVPDRTDAPALLDRLAVRPDDAAEILAGWPDPDSTQWTPELRWLLDRSIALVRADLGATSGCRPVRRYRASGAPPGDTSTSTRTWPLSTWSGSITVTTPFPTPSPG
ncbi:hypothetical protein GCM10029963_13780 [Micromonospora andamanensis]